MAALFKAAPSLCAVFKQDLVSLLLNDLKPPLPEYIYTSKDSSLLYAGYLIVTLA
jgi:hypothetical protein